MFIKYLLNAILVGTVCFSATVQANANASDISAICERAAQRAAAESDVPLSVLRAISLTETGRQQKGSFEPWPWTVNMEGVGKWFDSYEEAKSYVDRHFDRGARSFDVGCFQINYRWHHKAFSSIEQMFDPLANARYAAKFLSELYQEFGSWPKAAGAYHSRTPKYAQKYTARFNRIRSRLDPPSLPDAIASVEPRQDPEPPTQPERVNTYPLLQRGGPGHMASLVPLGQVAGARLIDVSNSSIAPVN